MLDNYVFISAQPFDSYFVWQVEVQIVNFRKFSVSHLMQVLIWFPDNKTDLSEWIKLAAKYPEVRFFFYRDEGVNLDLYIPQLRPHILKRHFRNNPSLKNMTIFYHDSDIIFNYFPDLSILQKGEINYVSSASHYLDYTYIHNKEKVGKIPEDLVVNKLCEIGNISPLLFKSYDRKMGGAQYVMKNIDSSFWEDVENQCLKIRDFLWRGDDGWKKEIRLHSINHLYFGNEKDGFQSWCADMWAVNFALWNRGRITECTPLLDFSWATDDRATYLAKPIFHNAGANGTQVGIFNKGRWKDKTPIGINHAVKKDSASWFYVQAIKEVKK